MAATATKAALVSQILERRIFLIRGQKVMLDRDLAEIYQVPTKRLNEQVRRNPGRFPKDFMFELTKTETRNLKSHFAASSWGGSRKAPLAFTEHGVAMLSAVLNSERAVKMSIVVIRAFVKLREMLSTNKEFAYRLERVESTQAQHGSVIGHLVDEIQRIKTPAPSPRRKIGFQ